MSKERYQNPVCGDTISLRLFTYNSNVRTDVQQIMEVNVFFIDKTAINTNNPEGLVLVETIPASSVTQAGTGEYLTSLYIDPERYQIGSYIDVWSVVFQSGECATAEIRNHFAVSPSLWFTTPTPPVYDFNFNFRPNRIRKGTKRYILVQVTPNVPRGSDVVQYYENLATVSDLRVSIEMACGDCLPAEQDLRLVVDRELVNYREKSYGYYYIDTTQFDEGIYNIWFEVVLGENVYVSEKNALQIHS
jgi:hypothetical protein